MQKVANRHQVSIRSDAQTPAVAPGRRGKTAPSPQRISGHRDFRTHGPENSSETGSKTSLSEAIAEVAAIRRSQPVIEYAMDGTILDANQALLDIFGYALDDLKGHDHSALVDEATRRSPEYKQRWEALKQGEHRALEMKYVGKNGSESWVRAQMTPILDAEGKPFKIVCYATDVTAQKHASRVLADRIGRISQGEIPPQITESLGSDFDPIRNSLNACVDGFQAITEVDSILKRMAVNDYTQHVEGKHPGLFGELAKATNETMDHSRVVLSAIQQAAHGDVSYLVEMRKIRRRCENDEVIPALTLLMETLELLIKDTEMLSQAALEGRLGTRIDASRQQGDFRKIVDGMNRMMEMFAEPIKMVSENTSTLASSSEEMSSVSQQLAGNAEETATQANLVSAASEQISGNVASVSSACTQMQASIREIASHASESASVAKHAVEVAQSTNRTVAKLGESSQEIGDVIKVITSIAQQTNLLALNATIEAARAGEAGKGFAVVANEVKELAKQTATATGDIGKKIEAIQNDTGSAVKAIEEIGSVINTINDVSNSIATAVEEQTVTTNEIVRSVNEASKGVNDIAKNIGGVAVAAKNTTQGASDTQQASSQLSRMAAQLQQVVAKFTF